MHRKKKAKPREHLRYEVEVTNWEAYYGFRVDDQRFKFGPGDFHESRTLGILGDLKYPTIKNATQVEITLAPDRSLNEYWKPCQEDPPLSIGFVQLQPERQMLSVYCRIPANSMVFLATVLASGKVKRMSFYGEALKWRRGLVFDVSVSTTRDEE